MSISARRALLWAAPVLLLAACGGGSTASSSGGGGGSSTPTVDAAAASQVPAAIASKGSITVAADATYAPDEFIGSDGSTVVGMDADLAAALGQVLGLKVTVVNATFDTIIPGILSGKYDLGMSSFTDTKDREKQLDFVDYFSSGESFLVNASSSLNIQSLGDICGKTVGVESGTTEQTDAQTQDAACKAAGKPGVTVSTFPDQNSVNLALSSGRTDADFLDSQIASYQASISNGKFKVSGPAFNTAPYGIAVPKGGFAQAILAALKDLEANGQYLAILKKWGIQAGAIPASQMVVNGATS